MASVLDGAFVLDSFSGGGLFEGIKGAAPRRAACGSLMSIWRSWDEARVAM